MSTNYYVNDPKGSTMHIGKSSAGWQFLFEVGNRDGLDPIDSFEGWMNYLDIATRMGHSIEDEYGRQVELRDLRELIIDKQRTGKNYWTASDDYLSPASVCNRVKGDSGENYDRKGFRFSKYKDFS